MTQLGKGQEVRYRIFKAKIVACTSPAPQPWYESWIGKTVQVQERQYSQDGVPTGSSYWVSTGPGMGFNGSISKDDFREAGS